MAEDYTIILEDMLSHRDLSRPSLLHDYASDMNMDVAALVASGDCFVTMATTLDSLNKLLATQTVAKQPELERVIHTLLYLQQHYAIVKKQPRRR